MAMEYEDRHLQASKPKYDCLVFAECKKNIRDYMVEKLGIDQSKVSEMSSFLYKNYGNTVAGLRAFGYKFDYNDYHSFVHGRLPYDKLKPDPFLRQLLLSITVRKVIFTNADKIHAAKVLSRLRLEDCFDEILSFETFNPHTEDLSSDLIPITEGQIFNIIEQFSTSQSKNALPKTPILCKPSEFAMIRALEIAKIKPQRTIFFDDSIRNIQAGKQIELQTALVGTSHRMKGADYALESLHNMREALPELWEDRENSEDARYARRAMIKATISV